MKHLVVAVSPDSSLELLGSFADIIVLDKEPLPTSLPCYATLYIRSHFGQPATLPQNFRTEIIDLVQQVKQVNPDIKFIDDVDTVDKILAFENKWLQYKTFSDFMPKTQLLDDKLNIASFERPVFKNRLSSRGNGVTWNIENITSFAGDWIIQESLIIAEELRVYVIHGKVYPIGAIRQSMTLEHNTQAVGFRHLTPGEIDFALKISRQAHTMDIIGLDIARTSDEKLYLMEVNRSPGFAAFAKFTGVNLASLLYGEIS